MQGEEVGLAFILGGMGIGALAVTGGIVSGIVRSYQRQKLVEILQRERVALIERGIDVEKLPAVSNSAIVAAFGTGATDERVAAERRRQGLAITGLVFTLFGIALGVFLSKVAGEDGVWTIGLMPLSIGLALLIGSSVVKAPDIAK